MNLNHTEFSFTNPNTAPQGVVACCVPCEAVTHHLLVAVLQANPTSIHEALYCTACKTMTYRNMDTGSGWYARPEIEGKYDVVKKVEGKYVVGNMRMIPK